jgi:hypothetical protein
MPQLFIIALFGSAMFATVMTTIVGVATTPRRRDAQRG